MAWIPVVTSWYSTEVLHGFLTAFRSTGLDGTVGQLDGIRGQLDFVNNK
jgi:hypothetical protein